MIVVATLLCALVGFTLGGLGGGGAILALPLLVYVAGLDPATAVAVSQLVVGVTAALSVIVHARAGNVDARTALVFSAGGIPGALVGAHGTSLVEPRALLGSFAVLLAGVALWMGLGRVPEPRPRRAWPLIAAIGLAVGLMSGFFGVGGGFLVVPFLTGLAGLEMRRAIGTSLVVIAINSAAGMVEHAQHADLPLARAAAFTAAAVIGALIGQRVSARLAAAQLRRAFAILIAIVSGLVTWQVVAAW
jgi:uncharacterized protein